MSSEKLYAGQTVAQWKEIFDQINDDCMAADGAEAYVAMTPEPEHVDYYTEQIWCMTDEGGLSRRDCRRLATLICKERQ
jgi:hypothetical protein